MKTTTCDWCGRDLGPGGEHDTLEPEACNNRECQREIRAMYLEADEDRAERARADDYARY